MVKMGNWREANEILQDCDIKPYKGIDILATSACGRVIANLSYIDDVLKKRFPEEWNKYSMEEIIARHYGRECSERIKELL